MMFNDFYRGKKVLVTGHTGFKGAWLCVLLKRLCADVYGYSLEPPTDPSLYDLVGMDSFVHSEIGDIRDFEHLNSYVQKVRPDVVLHLAAQPIVKIGYSEPRLTYETNVMGTVNILEAVRNCDSIISFLNVTTDKVYDNIDEKFIYTEEDRIDGYDPYSNSKSCSELVTHSYKRSFFGDSKCAISTARAGNVIGGGDFAAFRIIPDCVTAGLKNETIIIRNPHSVRPFQHVLEPLVAYLTIAEAQVRDKGLSGSYNVGPDVEDCVNAGDLATMFCKHWGNGLAWKNVGDNGPHESNFLRLDCSLIKKTFNYAPRWHIETAVEKVIEWSKVWAACGDMLGCMNKQIDEFLGE